MHINGQKEFTSISNVLPLIETQLWYIQISTIYHPFLRDSIGNTIMQCTEHITLDVYCKVQKVYLKNSKYWWVQVQKTAWDTIWILVCMVKNVHDQHNTSKHCLVLHSPILWNFEVNSFASCNTHLMWCVLCIAWCIAYGIPENGWYMVEICIYHSCVSIRGNTLLIDVNSFVPLYIAYRTFI